MPATSQLPTIRILISSPGDVEKERGRAREVIDSLKARYARHLLLVPVLWQDMVLEPELPFQVAIDRVLSEKGVDIAIIILWSKLGSPVGPRILKPNGGEYRSGTEREYDLMMQARARSAETGGKLRPAMLVYTRSDDASFGERMRDAATTLKQKELLQQKELVESFIQENFWDAESGTNNRLYYPYDRPITFSQNLRTHLQAILDELIHESDEVIWDSHTRGAPFLGLAAFQPEHATVFFGREEEILEARNALKEQARNGCAFLLLSGASGSGKSSLARAGLLPAIVQHELDEHVTEWRSLILTPANLGLDPISALANFMAGDAILPELRGDADAIDELIDGLKKDPKLAYRLRIKDALAKASARQGGGVRLLLVLDQLEEIFGNQQECAAFLDVIEAFARSGSIWVIATMRSDFYQQMLSQPALVRMKAGRGQMDVLPPGPDALARIIEEPARLAGLQFESKNNQSLSSRILKDAVNHTELLPLVEFILRELYEMREGNRLLTFAAYEQLGGVSGALAKHAEATFDALSEDARKSLPFVLDALITLGKDGESTTVGTERAVRQRAPIAGFKDHPHAREVVNAFIAARLFTTSKCETTAEPSVTIAHESILLLWPRAVQFIESSRAMLRIRSRVITRMREGSPILPADPLLNEAEQWIIKSQHSWTTEQFAFIRQQLERRRKSKIQRTLLLSALGLFLFIAYIAASDSGMALPAGKAIGRILDRYNLSIFRAVPSDEKIAAAAKSAQQIMLTEVDRAWGDIYINNQLDPWSTSQAISSILVTKDSTQAQVDRAFDNLEQLFHKDLRREHAGTLYGWEVMPRGFAQAEAAIWTISALSAAKIRFGDQTEKIIPDFDHKLAYTQQVADMYRSKTQDGWWNMFVNQENDGAFSLYSTSLALRALLDLKAAGLPWQGSASNLDSMIQATAERLQESVTTENQITGWRIEPPGTKNDNVLWDGITLGNYAGLLKAHTLCGIELDPRIVNGATAYLTTLGTRNPDFPMQTYRLTVKFENFDGQNKDYINSVTCTWLPEAIECCTTWLEWSQQTGHKEAPEDIVAVKRALANLVFKNLKSRDKAKEKPPLWSTSETLFRLRTLEVF